MEKGEEHADEGSGGETKLRMMKETVNLECESSCAVVKRKKERTMLMKLRGTTSDRGWKVARSGQGGESMQGMPVSRGGRRLSLADTVPCLGPPQAAFDDRSQPLGQIQRAES